MALVGVFPVLNYILIKYNDASKLVEPFNKSDRKLDNGLDDRFG